MQFSFRKPHFDILQILQKHYFGTMWHYLCFQKYPQNTMKMGKTVKQNLDQFLTLDLDQFLMLEIPNLGPAFNSTACMIYIYICLWARLPPQILAFLGKDKFDMFNMSAI